MGCAEYDRLQDEAKKLMIAENAAKNMSADSMSPEELHKLREDAHVKAMTAEYELNRHIDECPNCRADFRQHADLSAGVF